MAFPTLKELRDAVRLLGDFPSTNNPNDATLNLCINAELADLWERYSQHDPKSIEKTEEIALITGEGSYDLPEDFGVEVVVNHYDGKDLRKLDRAGYENMDVLSQMSAPSNYPSLYVLRNGEVVIWHEDTVRTGEQVLLTYHPVPPVLVDSEDEVANIPIAWKDYIILGAIARLCIREQTDPTTWQNQKAEVLDRIMSTARARRGPPAQVIDVNRRNINYDP